MYVSVCVAMRFLMIYTNNHFNMLRIMLHPLLKPINHLIERAHVDTLARVEVNKPIQQIIRASKRVEDLVPIVAVNLDHCPSLLHPMHVV